MHEFRLSKRIDSFDAWLDAATRGLCADARERIAEDVAAHFQDAVSDACEQGLTLDDAHANALRSLGQPKQSRRRLRRVHLTAREARSLNRIAKIRNERVLECGDANKYPQHLLYLGLSAMLIAVFIGAGIAYAGGDAATYIAAPCLFFWGLQPIGQYVLGHRCLTRKLHPNGRMPAWRAVQLGGFETLIQAWAMLCLFGLMSPESLLGISAKLNRNDSQVMWFFEFCLGVLMISALIQAMVQLRFARKLQRLDFNDPPSAKA